MNNDWCWKMDNDNEKLKVQKLEGLLGRWQLRTPDSTKEIYIYIMVWIWFTSHPLDCKVKDETFHFTLYTLHLHLTHCTSLPLSEVLVKNCDCGQRKREKEAKVSCTTGSGRWLHCYVLGWWAEQALFAFGIPQLQNLVNITPCFEGCGDSAVFSMCPVGGVRCGPNSNK